MRKLMLIPLLLLSCQRKPDFIRDGKAYVIDKRCVKYHYDRRVQMSYIWMGKMMMPTSYVQTIKVCDSSVLDTTELKVK